MRADCHVCRSEGFSAHSRVMITTERASIADPSGHGGRALHRHRAVGLSDRMCSGGDESGRSRRADPRHGPGGRTRDVGRSGRRRQTRRRRPAGEPHDADRRVDRGGSRRVYSEDVIPRDHVAGGHCRCDGNADQGRSRSQGDAPRRRARGRVRGLGRSHSPQPRRRPPDSRGTCPRPRQRRATGRFRVVEEGRGRLQELGPADVVFEGPHHPYTEALLSAVPTIDGGGRDRIRLQGDVPSAAEPPSGCVFHTRCHRKVGPVCEVQEPPLVEVETGHMMRCHIPVDELRELQRDEAARV